MWPFKKSLQIKNFSSECILKNIIDDLDIKNVKHWRYYSTKCASTLINQNKGYSLYVETNHWVSRKRESWLYDYSEIFTQAQKELLYIHSFRMMTYIDKLKNDREREKQLNRLSRLFPACFK